MRARRRVRGELRRCRGTGSSAIRQEPKASRTGRPGSGVLSTLQAKAPLKFGEHCSAFINSDIRKAIQQGAAREDIVAGLVFSIVANYLNRVVGNRAIGEHIVLQGGVAKNPAAVRAIRQLVQENYGERTLNISPFARNRDLRVTLDEPLAGRRVFQAVAQKRRDRIDDGPVRRRVRRPRGGRRRGRGPR